MCASFAESGRSAETPGGSVSSLLNAFSFKLGLKSLLDLGPLSSVDTDRRVRLVLRDFLLHSLTTAVTGPPLGPKEVRSKPEEMRSTLASVWKAAACNCNCCLCADNSVLAFDKKVGLEAVNLPRRFFRDFSAQ